MSRARLSKRLDDATAIRLFAEHHIVHVRRRKNGEIVAVKHATFGWMSPETYYGLQKLHDLMPLAQEFIRGGYQAKAWLWSINVDVLGITLPVGTALPVIETWNLYSELTRTKTEQIWHPETIVEGGRKHEGYWETVVVPDPHWEMIALRAYALLGPWGDIIQIWDSMSAVSSEASTPRGLLELFLFGPAGKPILDFFQMTYPTL